MSDSQWRPTQDEHNAADYRSINPSDVRAGMWFNVPDSIGPVWCRVATQFDECTWLTNYGQRVPVEMCRRVLNAEALMVAESANDSWEEVTRLRELAEASARDGDTLLAAFYDTRASQMRDRMLASDTLECIPGVRCTKTSGCAMAERHVPPCRADGGPCQICNSPPWDVCRIDATKETT